MDLANINIKRYKEGVERKDFSIHEVVSEYIKNIEKKDNDINAFLEVYKKEALDEARKLDMQSPDGRELFGVPIAIKDNILIKNKRATGGSKILSKYNATYDATVTKKIKDSGAIILGKVNLDEFAMGSSTENSAFQTTKNPVDLERVPGGSSGGSASAVAGKMAMVALGSDTGGSIRQPAGFCGIVGFKPTYGTVSRYGLIALSSSLDQIGTLTNSVIDSARVFSVISGHDLFDSTSVNEDFSDTYKLDKLSPNKITIGIPKEYFVDGMQKDVEVSVKNVAQKLENAGFKVKEISLPHTEYAISVYYIIMTAEASANLSRFDGIRYSRLPNLSEHNDITLSDLYLKQRGEGIGDEAKRRILLGSFVLSAGYYDAYYSKAQKVRRLILNDFIDVFSDGIDAIITPVTPTTAFKIGEKKNDPLSMYLSDIFTIPVNLAGLPAISIPTGEVDKNKLPIGFQLIGNHFREKTILSIGDYFQNNIL